MGTPKLKAFVYYFLILIVLVACKGNNDYSVVTNSGETAQFVGSASCKSCHETEYALWENSHHDLAMKLADSTSVLGDFNNTEFVHLGVTSRFFKKDGDYYMNTADENGVYQDYKIVYTFGYYPLQQYVIAFPKGEYQCSIVAWDSKDQKWFHLQPNYDDLAHGEWLNWTGGAMSWNTMCVDCHSTDLKKNYDHITDSFNTTFSEINVSCEACHGPMSEHNSFYETHKDDYEGLTPPEMYMPSGLPSKELVDKCARCHSRRAQITNNFDYKGEFSDHYRLSLPEVPLYYADGQILDEDYVYGSFIQSKMYHNGISCRDCHDVHSLKLKKTGNDLCMTCHTPNYNTKEHHFHEVGTDGASCINCHMPGKLYMVNDFRRDHSFRIPRPDHSVKYGVPNACNTCHTDKSYEWAQDFVIEKYGPERADHFSDHMLKGYYEDNDQFKKVFENKLYPDIIRASALNQYADKGTLTEAEINALSVYLKDPSVLVRMQAISAFEKNNVASAKNKIAPLLKDSVRVVRITAASYFNKSFVDTIGVKDFELANKEFIDQLDINADFASGQHARAIYFQEKGDINAAIDAYKKALKIDDRYNMSRMNLALIYYQQGQVKESEKLYLRVIEIEPEFSYSYYMLGLMYNELGNATKAKEYLKQACEKQPFNANAFYNYIVLLQQNGQYEKSIEMANKALKESPDNERILYVKLVALANLNKLKEANETCLKLIQIAPTNQNYQQILGNIVEQMR
jgi:tetratricopeptide (TPR) repeat protein